MIEEMNLGVLNSPKDNRDFNLAAVQPAIDEIPEIYSTDLSDIPVLFQGQQPACVWHAVATFVMKMGDSNTKDACPRYGYALSKKIDGIPEAEGTYPRTALLDVLRVDGICDNKQFPNNVNLPKNEYKDWTKITPEAYDLGEERQIKSAARLFDLSFDGIKRAIYANKLLLGTMRWENQSGPQIKITNPNTELQHEVVFCGYDKDYIYFRNSFGNSWGDNGDGWFGADYVPYITEVWSAVDLPDSIIQGLKSKLAILRKIVELYLKLLQLKRSLKK